MTTMIKQKEIGKFYITLEMTERWNQPIYKVSFNEKRGDQYYTDNEITYPIESKNKALATFNRYCKKAF